MATINHWWRQARLIVSVLMLLSVAGFVGAQWQSRVDAVERSVLIDRFPIVRADERAKCSAEFTAQVNGLKQLNEQGADDLATMKRSIADTNQIVAYTLRFLGDRARVNDARQAAMIRKTNEAAQAASIAAQKTEVVEQKVAVAAAKAVEAASTARAVDKKLDTAVQPPQQAQPWAGNRR